MQIREEREFSPSFLIQAEALYRAAGWIAEGESAAFLLPALRGSCSVAAAWEGNRLAGMGRAISDGVSDAYIQDLVVAPEFRGRGIGRSLVEHLVCHLQKRGVDWIALVGEPGTEVFYQKLGWHPQRGFCFWKWRN